MTQNVIPETEIGLACARAFLEPARRARVDELLKGAIDWPRLIAMAERNGTLPLVSHHLIASFGSTLPGWVRDELHARVRAIVVRNLRMTSELIRVVRRLESCGVPALTYKGPALALTAYESLALRSFGDLDLLVPSRFVREAARILHEDGYRPVYRLSPAQEAAYLRTQCELIVERDDVRVEVHWDIVPRYFSLSLDLDRLWARATPATLAGATVHTLATEDLLLVLCAHGCKHCWDRLEWIASFAEVVHRHPTLDWVEVCSAAVRAGASRMLATSLELARTLMEVELPAPARAHVESDPAAGSLAHEIGRRLLSPQLQTLDRPGVMSFHLRMRERLSDRIHYTLRLATTQTLGDWDLVELPRGAGALYRVLRPLRLLGKFGARAIARSLGPLARG